MVNEELFNIEKDKKKLTILLEKHVSCILDEYNEYIPEDISKRLKNISNFEDLIHIENTGTVSLFVSNGEIYMPTDAYKVLKSMSKIPGFEVFKQHQTHNSKNMIINNNTYFTFIKHVFLKGVSPMEYFGEILLHEAMHLCGSGGFYALEEGFNELKTREIALKYNLETSCCGYPKETKIAYELQMILGKSVCDKLIFMSDLNQRLNYIKQEIGYEAAGLYIQVFQEMQIQFEPYMNKKYPGLLGIKNKCDEYKKIDYSKVFELINQYIIKNPVNKLENKKN